MQQRHETSTRPAGAEQIANRFREMSMKRHPVRGLSLHGEDDPFGASVACTFGSISRISIRPFSEHWHEPFRQFYDGCSPRWGLSARSRRFFDEHDTTESTLAAIAARVASRQDARFVMLTQGHVVGYLLIEEIDRIRAGKPTYFGETYYAMLGIGISDTLHGSGLGSFGMLFLKFVAALAGVGLGLCCNGRNLRAIRFYQRHGFVQAGQKEIFVAHTGQRGLEPWFILPRNELDVANDVSAQAQTKGMRA